MKNTKMSKRKKKIAKTYYKHEHDKIIQLNAGRCVWILRNFFIQNLLIYPNIIVEILK